MKNIISICIVFAVFVTTIISCKKNDGGNTTNFPATQGQFTATGGLTADFTGT
ncbi:MAG: hypothetical protein H7101_13245, partial [Deinococcales bacterium]|nr:hypothetical protein [Chitinophagaceae bacterium]